jgi:hypothetical protein
MAFEYEVASNIAGVNTPAVLTAVMVLLGVPGLITTVLPVDDALI